MKAKLADGIKEIDEYVAKKRSDEKLAKRRNSITKMIEAGNDNGMKSLYEHIDYVRKEAEAGKAKRIDVNLIGQAIVMDEDLVTEDNVSLIVGEHLKNGRLEDASDFISGCMTITSDNDEKFDMVYKVRKKIDYEINKKKAEDLIRSGEKSIEAIRHITGITDIDIIVAKRRIEAEKKNVVTQKGAAMPVHMIAHKDDGR